MTGNLLYIIQKDNNKIMVFDEIIKTAHTITINYRTIEKVDMFKNLDVLF